MKHRETLFTSLFRKRLRHFSWPLSAIEVTGELRKADFPLEARVKRTRYPFRVMRYWWAGCAIRDEARGKNESLVVVDAGCERGMMKRLTPQSQRCRWIGLDKHINRRHLQSLGYDQALTCDFSQGLPLRVNTADVIVCLHVLEHMADPKSVMDEFARILRPGGVLLVTVPVLPRLFARIRQRQFENQLRLGKRQHGHHVYAFSPGILRSIAKETGLEAEFMAGSHFLRWSGNLLENYKLWARINHFWGALFPAFGRELFVLFRFNETALGPKS